MTPKQLAETLANLKKELAEVQNRYNTCEEKRQEESRQFTTTIDEHHRASRERYHNEVDRLKRVHAEEIENLKKQFEAERGRDKALHSKEIESLISIQLEKTSKLTKQYESKLAAAEKKGTETEVGCAISFLRIYIYPRCSLFGSSPSSLITSSAM